MFKRLRLFYILLIYLFITQSDGFGSFSQKYLINKMIGVLPIEEEKRSTRSAVDNFVHRCLQSQLTLVVIATTFTIPYPAYGVASTYDASPMILFNHEFSDPLHPLCKRKIEVNGDGKTFHYSGTGVKSSISDNASVLRGCTQKEIKEFGLRQSAFDGEILPGNKISAGDGIHEGVWEPSNSKKSNLGYEDKDGIRWNDGNKWVVDDKPNTGNMVGAGVAYSWLGLSAFAGVKGVIDRINVNQTDP